MRTISVILIALHPPGICVTSLDPKLIERGIAATPGSVPLLSNVICLVKKIRFFRHPCRSLSKVHVSIGHTTIVASALFFGQKELSAYLGDGNTLSSSETQQSADVSVPSSSSRTALGANYHRSFPNINFDASSDYEFQSELIGSDEQRYGQEPVQWALLRFQQPVFCPLGSLLIASRLDMEDGSSHRPSSLSAEGREAINSSPSTQCRLAFYGPVRASLTDADVNKIKVYQPKEKTCDIFRLTDVRDQLCFELIAWRLFSSKHSTSMASFVGLVLETERGEQGVISASFGTDGKFKVKFPSGALASKLKTGANEYCICLFLISCVYP
jgi:selenocysteine-specific elongation factor